MIVNHAITMVAVLIGLPATFVTVDQDGMVLVQLFQTVLPGYKITCVWYSFAEKRLNLVVWNKRPIIKHRLPQPIHSLTQSGCGLSDHVVQ